jgi:D-arginine dehydrogenase
MSLKGGFFAARPILSDHPGKLDSGMDTQPASPQQDLPAEADIVIIGGGIAGAGAAAELAGKASVVLLEREDHCGYHATGRSAASFTENYGGQFIRRLAIASRAFLEAPPAGFAEAALMVRRGMITIARADQRKALAVQLEQGRALVPSIRAMTPQEAMAAVPVLRPDYVAAAFIEPESLEIDVDALHQGFLRQSRARGAQVLTDAGVQTIARRGGRWAVSTRRGTIRAPVVVNAAGAWADTVAAMAEIAQVGLTPMRRTAFIVPAPDGVNPLGWPLINDVDEQFYFKADAGRIFVSPADATPSPPMDAFAEDMDVAIGVERLESATTIAVRRVEHSWAGLRTFAPDGLPVVGMEGGGFFWLAGQGGYGIKTSPALSRAAAALILRGTFPDDLVDLGISAADLSPARLRPQSAA